jgi:dTDP-4-amino-4,6-dideoxygalactose transaminase
VDACPVCFNIDVNDARAKLTSKARAIIPVHLFGQSADMDAVMALAKEHNLRVIEDGAQSIGAAYKGKGSGTIGDFGAYSFFPSKNLGGLGDGGAIVCNDEALCTQAKILRMHGSHPKYFHHYIGGNFRLDALQAALLRVKIPRYDSYTAKRQANAAYYAERLLQLPGVAQADLAHCNDAKAQTAALAAAGAQIVLPVACQHNKHIWNQYTLRILGPARRDEFKNFLGSKQIGCEIYYPVTMDQQKCFAGTPAASRRGCEVAHQLAEEVVSIPIYPELTDAQKDEVIAAIAEFLA